MNLKSRSLYFCFFVGKKILEINNIPSFGKTYKINIDKLTIYLNTLSGDKHKIEQDILELSTRKGIDTDNVFMMLVEKSKLLEKHIERTKNLIKNFYKELNGRARD